MYGWWASHICIPPVQGLPEKPSIVKCRSSRRFSFSSPKLRNSTSHPSREIVYECSTEVSLEFLQPLCQIKWLTCFLWYIYSRARVRGPGWYSHCNVVKFYQAFCSFTRERLQNFLGNYWYVFFMIWNLRLNFARKFFKIFGGANSPLHW